MPRAVARCGTNSGYYRHLRTTKTPPCNDCLRAHADATAWRSTCTDCGRSCVGESCRRCQALHYARTRAAAEHSDDEIAFTGQWINNRGIWRAA